NMNSPGVGSFSMSVGGVTRISGTINGNGVLTFSNPVILLGNTTISSSSSTNPDVVFSDTVNGNFNLTVGNLPNFKAAVGNVTPIANFQVSGGGGTTVTLFSASAGTVNTTGTQSYQDLISMAQDVTLTSGGLVTFTGQSLQGQFTLAINGNVAFNEGIGTST